jgi:LPS export ABC transporter protein LptC
MNKIIFISGGGGFLFRIIVSFTAFALLFAACSFDYSSISGSETEKADIVMENIEYVRVRGGDPLVRFRAEYAERWEENQIMNLKDFSFEQMENNGDSVDAEGMAKTAAVQLESGNLTLSDGVRIRIDSEDIIIETASLEWKDKEKILSGRNEADVIIQRSDGTSFTGRGFYADARNRTWAFSGEVMGTYVEEDEEEDKKDREDKEFEPIQTEWSRGELEEIVPWEQVPRELVPEEPIQKAEPPTPIIPAEEK